MPTVSNFDFVIVQIIIIIIIIIFTPNIFTTASVNNVSRLEFDLTTIGALAQCFRQ